MKVLIDESKLREIMKERGVSTLKQLARECGIKPNTLYQANARSAYTAETLWLISDRLCCPINDFVYVDWSKD